MTIEQRIARLEKQNRWMKRVGGLMLACVACVVLMGQGKAKELPDLVARSLTIKDAGGKTRVEIGTGDRLAFVRLNGTSGKEQMGLNVHEERPILELRDKRGKTRLSLLVLEKQAELVLYTKDQKPRMTLRVIEDSPHLTLSGVNGDRLNLIVYEGVPSLELKDKHGKTRANLYLLAKGHPFLTLSSVNGKGGLGLDVFEDYPSLDMRDKHGKIRAKLSLFGGPSLELKDKQGQSRAVLGVTHTVGKRTGAETKTAENTLTMFDAKGNVIWQAPK